MGNYFQVPKRPVKNYPDLGPRPKSPRRPKKSKPKRPSNASVRCYYTNGYHSTRYTTSGTFIVDTIGQVFSGHSNSRTFTSNPNWKQQVAKGQNATYPYTRVGITIRPITWRGTSYSNNFGNPESNDNWGYALGGTQIQDSDDAATKDAALARFKNRLSGNIGNASLLPPLAESREIHGLVRQLNGFGEDVFKALISIKRTRGKSVLKLVGKVWLFFNFGTNPLIDDIAKAAQSIRDYQERSDHSTRISGTANRLWGSQSQSDIGLITSTGISLTAIAEARHKLSYRYVGSVSLTVKSNSSYSVADHLGLKWSQLPSALWELTPFSWVVDYFATVGPWLDDVFFTLPGSLKYLCLCRRYENKTVHTHRQRYGGTTSSNLLFKPGQSEYFSFTRSSLATLPTRALRVKSFDEIGKHGLSKLMNLASVLAGHL